MREELRRGALPEEIFFGIFYAGGTWRKNAAGGGKHIC
jgi:hypothetical protein